MPNTNVTHFPQLIKAAITIIPPNKVRVKHSSGGRFFVRFISQFLFNNSFSLIQLYKTGTKIRFASVAVTKPPTVGAAIGFMISDPEPVANITGRSAMIVVIVVIIAGLTLNNPASITV